MQVTKQSAARVTIAVASGTIAIVIGYNIEAYFAGWVSGWTPTTWWSEMSPLIIYGGPLFVIGCLLAVFVYANIFRPEQDGECRCRRCGYILKGISKPECPECGEVI